MGLAGRGLNTTHLHGPFLTVPATQGPERFQWCLCLWLHLHRWAIEPWPLNLGILTPEGRPLVAVQRQERQVADRDTAGDTDGAGHPLVSDHPGLANGDHVLELSLGLGLPDRPVTDGQRRVLDQGLEDPKI